MDLRFTLVSSYLEALSTEEVVRKEAVRNASLVSIPFCSTRSQVSSSCFIYKKISVYCFVVVKSGRFSSRLLAKTRL